MKRIISILVLIFLVSTVFAQNIETISTEPAEADETGSVEVDDTPMTDASTTEGLSVPEEVANLARAKSSMDECMRFLKNRYPNAAPARLKLACERLRKAVNNQVKQLDTERLRAVVANQQQKDMLLSLTQEKRERLAQLNNDQLAKVARLQQVQLEKLAALKQERLNKLIQLNEDKLEKLAKLGEDKLIKLTKLSEDRLDKIASLDEAQLRKLAALDRTRLNKLVQKSDNEIKAELAKYTIKKVKKTDLYRKRIVADAKLKAANKKFKSAVARYQDIKKELSEEKRAFKQALNEEDEEAAIEHAKAYLLKVADLVLNGLEKIEARVEENDDLSDDEVEEILTDIEEKKQEIEDAKTKVEEATTKEEVKEGGAQIVRLWERMKNKVLLHAARLYRAKVMDVLMRAEQLERKLDRGLAKLEEQGYDVSEIEEMVVEFNDKVDSAREKYREAQEKLREARELRTEDEVEREKIKELTDEARSLIKEAHELLKEAHSKLVEIFKEIRDIAGNTDAVNEEDEEYEIVEEIENEDDGSDDSDIDESGDDLSTDVEVDEESSA